MGVIDLSVPLTPETSVPPALRDHRMRTESRVAESRRGPHQIHVGFISLCLHTGTHVDAPLHALPGTRDIGQVGLEDLMGEAVLLDLGELAANRAIGVADLDPFGREVREKDIVVLYSHWSERMWGKREYWLASPYLTIEAARWLIEKKPKAVVFDFFEEEAARLTDLDPADFIVHREILGNGTLIVEHVINLREVSCKRFRFFAAPLKLNGLEGSPVRAFALVE